MGLFGRNPWKDGVRSRALVERVTVTSIYSGGDSMGIGATSPYTWLVLRVDTPTGPVLHEKKFVIRPTEMPAPGMRVEVAWIPDKLRTIDFTRGDGEPPDPGTPRGWAAGIFAVDALAEHDRRHKHADDLDWQRDAFRPGAAARRVRAEVVAQRGFSLSGGGRVDGGANRVEVDLALGDGDRRTVTCFTPGGAVPQTGDLIEVAITGDGRIALDSDERYQGPPGQALVLHTPPEVARRRAEAEARELAVPSMQVLAPAPTLMIFSKPSPIDGQLGALIDARGTMDPASFDDAVRRVLDGGLQYRALNRRQYRERLERVLGPGA